MVVGSKLTLHLFQQRERSRIPILDNILDVAHPNFFRSYTRQDTSGFHHYWWDSEFPNGKYTLIVEIDDSVTGSVNDGNKVVTNIQKANYPRTKDENPVLVGARGKYVLELSVAQYKTYKIKLRHD